MCCQPFTLLLCCITILYARNGILATSRCPCTWNSSTLTADCSYKFWLPSSELLTEVPSNDCVPSTTKILNLSNNNITYRPGQFQRFTELIQLDLSWNQHFTPGNKSFSGLRNLHELLLDYMNLKNFRRSLITKSSHIETLSLRGTVLGNLNSKLFDNLQNLKDLNLKDTQLHDTSSSPFAALTSLEHLNLAWNNDITLTKQSFTGLADLVSLDVSGCGLTYLTLNVFDELANLTELDLSENSLSEIRDNQFISLQQLQHLDLSYSSWYTQFHPLSFAGLYELKYLNLGNIRLRKSTSFPNDTFEPLHRIEELHLVRFCIDMESYQYLQENIGDNLRNLPSLKQFSVDNYVISSLDAGFSTLDKLQELKFDGGYDEKFQIDMFSNATFETLRNAPISTLALDNYETRHISPYTFLYFRHLASFESDKF